MEIVLLSYQQPIPVLIHTNFTVSVKAGKMLLNTDRPKFCKCS